MIRHRFIVGEADFRVFAAIPTESNLLTWKKWRRPPDWAALRLIVESARDLLDRLGVAWGDVSTGYHKISVIEVPENLAGSQMSENEAESRRTRARQSEETKVLSSMCLAEMSRCRELWQVLAEATDADDPSAASSEVRKFLVRVAGGVSTQSVDDLVASARKHVDYYQMRLHGKDTHFRKNLDVLGKKEANLVLDVVAALYSVYTVLMQVFNKILDMHAAAAALVREIDNFLEFKLPADLDCPVGVPFAAYTIELETDRRINVVEGCAWVEAVHHLTLLPRDSVTHDVVATEAEKRVAEIVSQMMTERGLNPKAPTRISVREVDPKQAHEQRQAEARGGPPRMRTVKYHVSPPRYLREAAEVILASPRKAHWVVGHWRNQPFGEGRTQHKQTWIKPHIRGLGEAGATAVKVIAQKGGRAEGQKLGETGDGS